MSFAHKVPTSTTENLLTLGAPPSRNPAQKQGSLVYGS